MSKAYIIISYCGTIVCTDMDIITFVMFSIKICDFDSQYRYIERLSKKSKNSDFSNLACNEINNLQASNSQI